MAASEMEAFGLSQIGQVAVPVTDLERTIPFYRDILGMRFLFQAPPGLAFFELSGVRLMLDGPAKAQAGRGVRFEAKPHLIAKMPDHELWMAFFRDPDKNLLALMSEVRQ